MATSYIIGRVENNDSYGLAIAYSTTLIILMLAVIVIMQMAVGKETLLPIRAGRKNNTLTEKLR